MTPPQHPSARQLGPPHPAAPGPEATPTDGPLPAPPHPQYPPTNPTTTPELSPPHPAGPEPESGPAHVLGGVGRSAAAGGVAGALLVPLYVHPAVDPGAWRALEEAAGRLYGVVVNVADGPGYERPDGAIGAAAARLRAAGVRLFGYVDTDYATRPTQEAERDVRRHLEWYGVCGVFFDRAAAGRDRLPYYRRLVSAARRCGARTVVLNPGVHPDPAYAAVCDLLVTYEGGWADYTAATVPGWTAALPPGRFCHLVYGVPGAAAARTVARTAAGRGAAVHCAVPGGPPNPWQHAPAGTA